MLAEIQVLPDPPGDAERAYRNVDAAIITIAAAGVRHEVGALGTTIEGPPDTLWPLLRAAHEACLSAGAGRMVTIIKVVEHAHADGALTIDALTAAHRGAQ